MNQEIEKLQNAIASREKQIERWYDKSDRAAEVKDGVNARLYANRAHELEAANIADHGKLFIALSRISSEAANAIISNEADLDRILRGQMADKPVSPREEVGA